VFGKYAIAQKSVPAVVIEPGQLSLVEFQEGPPNNLP
jgi:hypothetical protein